MTSKNAEVSIQLPEELIQEAQEFNVLTSETVEALVRAEVDRRIMDLVNGEIHVYRAEKAARRAANHDDKR